MRITPPKRKGKLQMANILKERRVAEDAWKQVTLAGLAADDVGTEPDDTITPFDAQMELVVGT